jgi:hypothetical protein
MYIYKCVNHNSQKLKVFHQLMPSSHPCETECSPMIVGLSMSLAMGVIISLEFVYINIVPAILGYELFPFERPL